jgi:hypothetical protein
MKKAILFLLGFLLFQALFIEAQDKPEKTATFKPSAWAKEQWRMTPDGYIGGATLVIEPGFDFASGKYQEDTEGLLLPRTPQFITQNTNIKNPFVKLSVLVPTIYNTTFFVNALASWFKQKGERNDYFFANELSYTRFSISAGVKIYIK